MGLSTTPHLSFASTVLWLPPLIYNSSRSVSQSFLSQDNIPTQLYDRYMCKQTLFHIWFYVSHVFKQSMFNGIWSPVCASCHVTLMDMFSHFLLNLCKSFRLTQR